MKQPTPLDGPRIFDGQRFAWGPIDAVHEVGDMQIVEYRVDKSNSRQPEYWHDHGQTQYHPYVNGRNLGRSYRSLDSALVGAIAIKREGPNGRAAEYFDRMTLTEDDQ